MSRLAELLARMQCPLAEQGVQEYANKGWIRPQGEYDEVDIARVRLIYTLHRELAIDEEALPVILSLLEQLHGTRQALKRIAHILSGQTAELKAEIAAALEEQLGGE